MAGSDTTAAAITSILYHLLRTPAAYAKLTGEIDEADNSGMLSPRLQYPEAVGLPYLIACCKEGMRLHPSVGVTLPRHIPKGGCVIAGGWFPEGTRVGVNAAVVQRDKNSANFLTRNSTRNRVVVARSATASPFVMKTPPSSANSILNRCQCLQSTSRRTPTRIQLLPSQGICQILRSTTPGLYGSPTGQRLQKGSK
jgi:hypothetical protein